MKVTEEEHNKMRELYLKFRSEGNAKQEARYLVSDAVDRGMTTVWDHTSDLDLETPTVERSRFKAEYPKSYILTGWELRVGIDEKFIECLKQMAQVYDAELLLVPCQASDARYAPEILKDNFHIITEDIIFNKNLVLKYVETNALIQSPLAGHVGAYPDTTCIIPGLVKELRTEPSHHYVKQLISTGSVGYLDAGHEDYSELEADKDFAKKWRTMISRKNGKPTAIAQNYISPSALVVDVLDDKTFVTRFVSSHRSGVVYDLNKRFTPTGFEESKPLALVAGDVHAYQVDDMAYEATKEMIQQLNPREVILHDFFDGASVNYHEIGSAVKFFKAPSMSEEAEISKQVLTELCELANRVTYIQSNHDNFLMKFLDKSETLWRLNGNYRTACELQLYRVQEDKHPIIKLLDLDKFKNLKFVPERENHYVGKVLCKHGHEGLSGVRVGFFSLAKTYNFYSQGHEHAPKVFRNAVCVGLIGRMDMEYVVGANGMLPANALIQPDSSQQLLPIIHGEWRI
jgi:hypothetical protein